MPRLCIGPPVSCPPPAGVDCHSMKTLDQRRILASLGLGLAITACIALAWYRCFPGSLPLGQPDWFAFVAVVLILTVGHEALHMLGFPGLGLDARTIAGVWPAGAGSPYVQHLAPMGRNRFLLACLMPFLVLTILPFALAAHDIGAVAYLSWISVGNCVGASSDLHIVAQVLRKVPSSAWVLESGDSLLWEKNPYEENGVSSLPPRGRD